MVEKLSLSEIGRIYKVTPQAIYQRLIRLPEYKDGGARSTKQAIQLYYSKSPTMETETSGFVIDLELKKWIEENSTCKSDLIRMALYELMKSDNVTPANLKEAKNHVTVNLLLYKNQADWLKTFPNRSAIVRAALWNFKKSYEEKSRL